LIRTRRLDHPIGPEIELMNIMAEHFKFNVTYRWTYFQPKHKNGSYRVNAPAYEANFIEVKLV
jgi:hypothetical protein